MVGMAELWAPISHDGVAVHPNYWCVCPCYLHFVPENTEDGEQRYDIWYSSCGCPQMPTQIGGGKSSRNAAQPCARVQGYVNDDLRADGLWKGWGFRVCTWNVDSLTGRAGDVVEALSGRKVNVACIQETQRKCSGCKFFEAKGQRYKMFWMGGEERSDNVGIFVAEKWVDSVVISIERHIKRVLILKMVLDDGLLNILMVYAPHSWKSEEGKRVFGTNCSIW